MPEQMFKYRATSFFYQIYPPDIFMMMYTSDEARDMNSITTIDIQKRKQSSHKTSGDL